ncbi:MAG: hypothetical protein KGH57_03145 [Candidatus Micrarchaeota archaeon]|nr:hypothetical protein [Candidatus Micrarchaeota archaeon]
MKRKVLASKRIKRHLRLCGSGWIGTGFVSIAAWAFTSVSVCNCPAIPAGATPQQIASICQCGPNAFGFLPVGVLAILVGMAIFLLGRRLEGLLSRVDRGRRGA